MRRNRNLVTSVFFLGCTSSFTAPPTSRAQRGVWNRYLPSLSPSPSFWLLVCILVPLNESWFDTGLCSSISPPSSFSTAASSSFAFSFLAADPTRTAPLIFPHPFTSGRGMPPPPLSWGTASSLVIFLRDLPVLLLKSVAPSLTNASTPWCALDAGGISASCSSTPCLEYASSSALLLLRMETFTCCIILSCLVRLTILFVLGLLRDFLAVRGEARGEVRGEVRTVTGVSSSTVPPSSSACETSRSARAAAAFSASLSFRPAIFFEELPPRWAFRSLSLSSLSLCSMAWMMHVSASSSCGLAAISAIVIIFLLLSTESRKLTPSNSTDVGAASEGFSVAAAELAAVAATAAGAAIFRFPVGGDIFGDSPPPITAAPSSTSASTLATLVSTLAFAL
mmetsp:Transcript_21782/g.48729  ORF Transcript_21782/g.48729 Transcript_21782/m.48729 type:complete len:395 (-) Transcript_21782:1288-2472(-)